MKYVVSWAGFLVFALAAGSTAATGSAQVAFSPESVDVNTGDTVAIDVTVANVDPDPGLGSYDLTLAFDPAVVRLDSFSDSGFITSGQNVVICVTGQIDNTGGSVNATCTAIPLFGAPGLSITGPVALLHASTRPGPRPKPAPRSPPSGRLARAFPRSLPGRSYTFRLPG